MAPNCDRMKKETKTSSKPVKKKAPNSTFKGRLDANKESLKEQFYNLYWWNSEVEQKFDQLINALQNGYKNRPDRLKQIDQKRVADPFWYLSEKWAGMMLYPDLFGQNLRGVQSKLGYLEELGINLVHLMPLLKSPEKNNDGGYAVSDYRQVDPKLGSNADLQSLSEELHEKDMLLMLDYVLNHTSSEHEWAEKARKGDKQYLDYYYFIDNKHIVDQFEESLPEVFPENSPGNFTFIKEVNKYVMTVFNSYQWDLNYSNPAVFIEMVDVAIHLANLGVDILRLDALAFMWKRMGTDSQNLPEAHWLVQTMRTCMRIVAPGTLFLAEAIVPPDEIVKYFGTGQVPPDECEMAYNATFMVVLWDAIATKNNFLTLSTLHHIPSKPFGASWLSYIRCHDDIGLGYRDDHAERSGHDPISHRKFLSDFLIGRHPYSFSKGAAFMENYKTGDVRISGSLASLAGLESALESKDEWQIEASLRRITLLHSMILAYGGIPMIYSGDELATLNDYSYLKDDSKSDDNRWMHRPEMDWNRAKKRNQKGTPEQRIFTELQRLIEVRKQSPELADVNNRMLPDLHNGHVLGIFRSLSGSFTLAVANLNDHPERIQQTDISMLGFDPRKKIHDKISDSEMEVKNGQILLEAYGTYWLTQ